MHMRLNIVLFKAICLYSYAGNIGNPYPWIWSTFVCGNISFLIAFYASKR